MSYLPPAACGPAGYEMWSYFLLQVFKKLPPYSEDVSDRSTTADAAGLHVGEHHGQKVSYVYILLPCLTGN